MDYAEFLTTKSQLNAGNGFEPVWLPGADSPFQLKPFQEHLVAWAIRNGRCALFEDCGLGKTFQYLVWAENVARKTGGNVLIICPLAVAAQTVREGVKFGIECTLSRDGQPHRIAVTNYESLHKFDSTHYIGAVADESGAIKAFSGKRRRQVVRFFSKLPYRLLCTATPSPNDYIELGTQSECLGVMTQSEMLGYFFRQTDNMRHTVFRDGDFWNVTKYHFKPHSAQPFWRWVSSWARAVRTPSDVGFSNDGYILPPLDYKHHVLDIPFIPEGELFHRPATTLREQRQERQRTVRERCERVAELLTLDRPAIAWCHYNVEGQTIAKMIPDAVEVAGRHDDDYKADMLNDFAMGNIRVLVSKPKIACWGMNYQHCADMTFFPTFCYDEMTEILTRKGWMTFDRVTVDDEVATVNQDGMAFEWQNPTATTWKHYSGTMVRFDASNGIDLLVTPNHRMLVKRCPIRYRCNGQWEIKTAEELMTGFKRQEYRMLSAPLAFVGDEIAAIEIPPYVCRPRRSINAVNRSGDGRGMSAVSQVNLDRGRPVIAIQPIPIADFMALAGWYLSEGHCSKAGGKINGNIVICQTDVNPEYRAEIAALLRSITGLNVCDKTKDIRACSKQLAIYLVDQFGRGSYNKRIPAWVKDLAPRHLAILRDTMLKGDGCSHYRGGPKLFYRTVSRRLADDFCEICLKTGIRASVRWRQGTGNYVDRGCWDVNLARQHTEPSIYKRPESVDYTGMIGCVSVPNGLVIVRRNGIPIVSGNSFEQFYQAVRRCYRFGQPRQVNVHVVSAEGESHVMEGLTIKQNQAAAMFASLVKHMNDALAINADDQHTQTAAAIPWLQTQGESVCQ